MSGGPADRMDKTPSVFRVYVLGGKGDSNLEKGVKVLDEDVLSAGGESPGQRSGRERAREGGYS